MALRRWLSQGALLAVSGAALLGCGSDTTNLFATNGSGGSTGLDAGAGGAPANGGTLGGGGSNPTGGASNGGFGASGASNGGASGNTGGTGSLDGAVPDASGTGGVLGSGGAPDASASNGGTPGSGGAPDAGASNGGASSGGTGGVSSGGASNGGTGGVSSGGASNGGAGGACSGDSCFSCAHDADCAGDAGPGAGTICVGGKCTAGDCHADADCPNGGICGRLTPNTCAPCTSSVACASAYGAGHVCVSGACVPGDCAPDEACPAGEICGESALNTCGKCKSDAECKNDSAYGAGFICNTTTGACVTSACEPSDGACASNGADFCCGGTCVAGDCCSTADCANLGNKYACVSHECTLCPAVTNGTYVVDPKNGSDTIGTGDGSGGCAFKTITRALTVIGTASNAATVLVMSTQAASTATGETFPISVPANVTIDGSGGNGTATVLVPKDGTAFTLAHANSTLQKLAVDGQSGQGLVGISVTTGAALATTTISEVLVDDVSTDGIRVAGSGAVTIGQGVYCTQNGAAGLHVLGQGKASVVVNSGDAVHFDGNVYGIDVTGNGSVTVTGKPKTGGNGSITASGNTTAGLFIEQEPGVALTPVNTVTGLVAWGNVGDGIHVFGGSALTLRGSSVLANQGNGVLVSSYVVGKVENNNIGRIDLGLGGQNPVYGGNTLQSSAGQTPNVDAGICLALARGAGASLNAVGNIFAGPTDCRSSTATLTHNRTCSDGVDYAVQGLVSATTNAVDVTNCK